MQKKLCAGLLAGALSAAALADVNVYSYRQDFLVQPVLDAFTAETGIKTKVVYIKDGLVERLKEEGKFSPADVILTVDISRLQQLVKEGVVQSISTDEIEKNVPAYLRGADWVALTSRARVIYSSKERVGKLPADFSYLDLAKPEWKGKVCIRSGKNAYNLSLIASVIAHEGEVKAKEWLTGLKTNLARKPQGNDREQVKAIMEGVCDVSVGNSYYYGKMLDDEKQRAWAESVEVNLPNQASYGTHINVSGAALAKYAPHKESAVRLIEFLTSDNAQKIYAEINHEYPVKESIPASELLQSWGEFKRDQIQITDIAKYYQQASKLVDEVQFDL